MSENIGTPKSNAGLVQLTAHVIYLFVLFKGIVQIFKNYPFNAVIKCHMFCLEPRLSLVNRAYAHSFTFNPSDLFTL